MDHYRLLSLPLLLATLLVVLIARDDERDVRELTGTLEPGSFVTVGSASPGVLESVVVDEGDWVHDGQLVAELDLSVERAALALAKARSEHSSVLRSAELELVRAEEKLANHHALYEEGILTSDDLHDTQVEKTRAELAVERAREERILAELEMRHARALLERGRIRSPIAGTIVARRRASGEPVGGPYGLEVATIAQLDPLRVRIEAPASMLGRIRPGADVEVVLEQNGETRPARVRAVSPLLDELTRTFDVTVSVPNPDLRITPGFRCRVRIPERAPTLRD